MDIRTEKITALSDEDLRKIVSWMYSWWGEREGYSYDAITEYYIHSLNESRLPVTYGLYEGDTLVGTFQITNSDLFVRPDIYPWLANVYVDSSRRGLGYGRILLESIPAVMESLGISALHLFTTHEGFYEKYGWEYTGEIRTFLPDSHIQRLYCMKVMHDNHVG